MFFLAILLLANFCNSKIECGQCASGCNFEGDESCLGSIQGFDKAYCNEAKGRWCDGSDAVPAGYKMENLYKLTAWTNVPLYIQELKSELTGVGMMVQVTEVESLNRECGAGCHQFEVFGLSAADADHYLIRVFNKAPTKSTALLEKMTVHPNILTPESRLSSSLQSVNRQLKAALKAALDD